MPFAGIEKALRQGDVPVCRVYADSDFADPIHLPDHERAAAVRLIRQADRSAFVACRNVLRRVLGPLVGCAPADVPISVMPGGKPELDGGDFSFSIAHAAGMSLIALVAQGRVGVDLEHRDRAVDDRLVTKSFLPLSQQGRIAQMDELCRKNAFLVAWTQNEATVKATGQGLVVPADECPEDAEGLTTRRIEVGRAWFAALATDRDCWRPVII